MSVNKAILVGRLGADPEVKTSQAGTSVANLRLATSERRKDRDGNWQDHTEWHRIVCFGRTAENVDRFCRKGKELYVEGRIQTRKWQDSTGADRWSTEIVADVIRFIGSSSDGGGEREQRPDSGGYGRTTTAPAAETHGHGPDDDIPF